MKVISLELPAQSHADLNAVSIKPDLSKSTAERAASVQTPLPQVGLANSAEQWVQQWHGSLKLPPVEQVKVKDPRLAHLLNKHLR